MLVGSLYVAIDTEGAPVATEQTPENQYQFFLPETIIERYQRAIIGLNIDFFQDYRLSYPDQQIINTPEPDPLAEYLQRIEPEKERFEEILISYKGNVMEGIKDFSLEENLEDFRIYYPIWEAVEEEFGVPWTLSWTVQAGESTVSRHTINPRSVHVGTVQRLRNHKLLTYANPLNGELEHEVVRDWIFLKSLPRRWANGEPPYSDDFVELFWLGEFLERKAMELYPRLRKVAGMEEVVRKNYSAFGGEDRVRKHKQLQTLFQISS